MGDRESLFMIMIVHTGADYWVPTSQDVQRLEERFPGDGYLVHLWPRRAAPYVLGRPMNDPYAFRAFTRRGDSHVFVDPTETQQSIAWLIGHELGHQDLEEHRQALDARFAQQRPQDLDPQGDEFHRFDPEERWCDHQSTEALGYTFDRDWWRARVNRRLRNI